MGCSNSIPRSPSAAAVSSSTNKFIPQPFTEEPIDDWYLHEKLGEGAFASVWAVRHKFTGQSAAVKVTEIPRDKHKAANEARIWEKIGSHPHILHLIKYCTVDGVQFMLMERCEQSLTERMHDMVISESTMAYMFHAMASAIAHIASRSIVHRDIKPDNFLCKDSQSLKLCDFGLARSIPKSGKLFGTYGTPLFMSPEMVSDGPHNLKTDVWSLGATCYLMLYGECPYTTFPSSSSSVMRAIASGLPEPKYLGRDNVSSTAKDTLAALLHRPMSTRISASQALQLPFFNSAVLHMKTSKESNETLSELMSQSTCDLGSSVYDSVSDGNLSPVPTISSTRTFSL